MQRIIYECDRCHQEIKEDGVMLEEFKLKTNLGVIGPQRHLCRVCAEAMVDWLTQTGAALRASAETRIDEDDPNYREVTMVEDENGNLYDPGAEPAKAYVKPGTIKPGTRKPIDMPKALAMREAKKPMKEIAEAMGVSIPTMRARFKKVDRARVSDGQA